MRKLLKNTRGPGGWPGTCVCEIEASEFGIEKSERESVTDAGFGYIMQPRDY